MADQHHTSPKWTDRFKRARDKPRVVHEDDAVFFCPSGIRLSMNPDKRRFDGFCNTDETFHIASSDDLKPENRERLKAALNDKIAHARTESFSAIEHRYFDTTLKRRSCMNFLSMATEGILEHYSARDPVIKKRFGDPIFKEHIKGGYFNIDGLFSNIRAYHNQDRDAVYDALKDWAQAHGKSKLFREAELKTAKTIVREYSASSGISHDTAAALAEKCVVDPQGTNDPVRIDMRPIQEFRTQLLDQTYRDLDHVIDNACAVCDDKRQRLGKKYLQDAPSAGLIDIMAQENVIGKPLIALGYHNPKLTILLEHAQSSSSVGLSYEGQDLIRTCTHPKIESYYDVLSEELLHQGFDKLYDNESLPYPKGDNARKRAFVAAVNDDLAHGSYYESLALCAATSYDVKNVESMHREAPVKILRILEQNLHDPEQAKIYKNAFPKLTAYIHEVILEDAKTKAASKPLADLDDLSAQSLIKASGKGWKKE